MEGNNFERKAVKAAASAWDGETPLKLHDDLTGTAEDASDFPDTEIAGFPEIDPSLLDETYRVEPSISSAQTEARGTIQNREVSGSAFDPRRSDVMIDDVNTAQLRKPSEAGRLEEDPIKIKTVLDSNPTLRDADLAKDGPEYSPMKGGPTDVSFSPDGKMQVTKPEKRSFWQRLTGK